jgi:hypothetical protein
LSRLSLETATSEASARELADALVEENIKKGWERISA